MLRGARALALPVVRPIRAVFRLAVTTIDCYARDHCGTYAAAVAYYTLFSFIPLTLVVVSIVGLVADQDRVVDFIFDQIPLEQTEEVRADVESAVGAAQSASTGGLVLGILVLLWSASGVFGAVRRGLNATDHRRGHSFVHGKIIDLALVPTAGLLLFAGLATLSATELALQEVATFGFIDLDDRTLALAAHAAAGTVSFLLFITLYRLVPLHPPPLRDAVPGAALAMVLFESAKTLAGIAIAQAPYSRDNALYAGLGTVLAVLFWVFVSASILLLGMEFARAIGDRRETAKATRASEAAPAALPAQTPGTTVAGP